MKRLAVTILAILGTLIGLVVVVLLTLPLWFDPNDYKDDLARLVESRTGRQLTIDGDLSLSYYPWLGVEARGVRLSNPPDFPAEAPFLQADLAGASVELLPLLQGTVQLDTVHLRGTELHLIRTAQGRTNWDFAPGAPAMDTPPDEPAPPTEETPPAEPGGPPQALGALAVAGVDVRNARVIWDDRSAGQRILVQDLSLATDAFGPGRTTELQGGFRLNSDEPALTSRVTYRGRIAVGPDLQTFGLQDFRLETDTRGDAVPGGQPLNATLVTDARLDLGADTLDVPNLRLMVADVTAEAQLGVRQLFTQPEVTGQLRVPPFNPRQALARFGLEDLETADPEALTEAQLQARIDASATQAALEDLEAQLDGSRLTGRLAATDLSLPAYAFDLSVDTLNVDRYLPPETAEREREGEAQPAAAAPASPAAAAAGGAAQIPVETLRGLNLNGTLTVGKLQAAGLEAGDVRVTARAQGGQVRVQPTIGQFYGGAYRGNVMVDARGQVPSYTTDERLENVQMGPLLKDAVGQDRLTGTAQLTAKLKARGATVEEMRRTLGGNAHARVTDGTLRGVNVAQLIREAYARIRGEPVPEQQGPQQTDFSELTADVILENGIVKDDLLLQSPLLRVNGEGSANLVKETLDYLVRAAIVGTLEGQGGRTLDELKGLVIPIRITGPWAEPKYRLDLQRALTEAQKEVVREKRDEIKEELKGKVEEKVQEKLLDFLSR